MLEEAAITALAFWEPDGKPGSRLVVLAAAESFWSPDGKPGPRVARDAAAASA